MSTRNINIVMFWSVNCCGCVGLITLPPSVSQLSRQCGILNISQPCRPPRSVTGIALLFTFYPSARNVEDNIPCRPRATAIGLSFYFFILINGSRALLLGLGCLSFPKSYTQSVGLLGRSISIARQRKQNKRTHRHQFLKRTKSVYASKRAVTFITLSAYTSQNYCLKETSASCYIEFFNNV
jgi:hypothetical protein